MTSFSFFLNRCISSSSISEFVPHSTYLLSFSFFSSTYSLVPKKNLSFCELLLFIIKKNSKWLKVDVWQATVMTSARQIDLQPNYLNNDYGTHRSGSSNISSSTMEIVNSRFVDNLPSRQFVTFLKPCHGLKRRLSTGIATDFNNEESSWRPGYFVKRFWWIPADTRRKPELASSSYGEVLSMRLCFSII